jgi:hypothetical protein
MRITPRVLMVGIWAACATPARLRDDLQGLLAQFEVQPSKLVSGGGVGASLKLARLSLRWLARLPGKRWRNTCLYRSVAECLALRRLDVPARLCLGVHGDGGSGHEVEAHAWVEIDGVGTANGEAPRTGVTPFVPRAGAEDDAQGPFGRA